MIRLRSRAASGRVVLALLALVALSLPALSPAVAVTTEKAWEESAGLRCLIDDAVDPGARIFESPDYQQTMVIPSSGETAYVFYLKAQSVRTMTKSLLRWDAGELPLVDLKEGQDAGGFVSDAGAMLFVGADGTVKLEPEPPLVGGIPSGDLAAKKPDYLAAAKGYTPDAKAIAALKAVKGETQVLVFFGSWCSHCKHWVPGFLRTIEAAGNAKITASYYGVSEDMAEPAADLKKYGVTKTPTFVVMQAGREIGRIEEEPTTTIEGDLARILANK